MNITETNVNINEVIGHYVEAEISLNSFMGSAKRTLIGRIVYSEYNASLFFKPKGNKNKGYIINSEEDIHTVKIIRRDKAKNEYYSFAYNNNKESEIELKERLERELQERIEREESRQQAIEEKKRLEREELEKVRSQKGYGELENEVVAFYQSFENEFFNESFVKNTYIPVLSNLVNKEIKNVNDYPKHYFDKKRNPKFCKMIETKLNIKLTNTQKGNVEKLNEYLAG